MTSRTLPLMAGLTVLLGAGLVHGVWTQRWQPSPALERACARLYNVPLTAGEWNGVQLTVDPQPYRQARAVGFWARRYTKAGVADSFTVILMCGRAGHMSTHTPNICYPSAGYEMIGEQVKLQVAGITGNSSAEFWSARFRLSAQETGSEISIHWAWSEGNKWQAPDWPRWTFGGEAFLYKLYVVRETTSMARQDPMAAEFIRHLAGVLDMSLVGDSQ